MRVWASTLGGFARSRLVRRVLRDYELGLVSYGDVEKVLLEASSAVIGVQVASGLAYVNDGMLDWHDIFRPFVESWRNVTPTGLLRFFDNNFFYRIPRFTGLPEPSRLVWAPRVRKFAPIAEPSGFKVVLPGPVTFALMSSNESGYSLEELSEAIAKLLAGEARAAVEAGASMVQIDEPTLADPEASRDSAVLAAELSSRIASASGPAKTLLALYFDVPRADVYEELLNSKVQCLSLDLIDAPERALKLLASKGFGGHCAVLGLVNSRAVHDDPIDRLSSIAEEALKDYRGEEAGLTTSTWLDLIPYDYSVRKARILGLLAEKLAYSRAWELVWRAG